MEKLIFGILISIVLFISSCCNDSVLPTSQNILKDKLKTFEDDRYKTGEDSVVKFYFIYDSLNGTLKNVSLNILFNSRDTLAPIFTIDKDNNGDINIIAGVFFGSPEMRKFKINTSGNRITSVVELDTINNTENIVAYTSFIGNTIDSAYNAGFPLNYNIRFSNFRFSNQNCTNYMINSIVQLISPPYNTVNRSSQSKINYTNQPLKNKLFSQNCMDISANINYGLLLYFLSVDGYYIIPSNQHLISDIITYTSNYDTSIVRYSYQYSNSNVTSVKRTYFSLSDTTIKTDYYQRMTYY